MTGTPNTALQKRNFNHLLPYGLLVIAFFGALYFFSPSVRGSDQYWYVGDIERVVLQDGLYVSNSVFPNSMPEDLSGLPRPWVQNKPATYFVLPIAWLTCNGHFAWLLFNTFCLFAAAFMTAGILKVKYRLLFVAAFVFFPFNFYLASQALTETFILFLIAAIHYLLLACKRNVPNMLLLGITAGLLILQRPNYLLLLPVIPVMLFLLDRNRWAVSSGLFLIPAVLMVCINGLLFPDHLVKSPGIVDTVVNNMPEKTNMGNFLYSYDNSELGISDLISVFLTKFQNAVASQFEIAGSSSVMFYLINIMLLGIVILAIKKKIRIPENAVSVVFVAIHFATVILFANQYRYAAAIIPSLFILDVNAMRNLTPGFLKTKEFRMGAICIFILTSFALGMRVRANALEEAQRNAELKAFITEKNIPALMCEWNNGGCLSVGYAVSPKYVYYFPRDFTTEAWLSAAAKMNTNHGIVYYESKLYKSLKPYISSEEKIKNTDMILFEIRQKDNK